MGDAAHVRWYNVLGLQFSMLPSKAKISSAASNTASNTSNNCSVVSSHQGTLKEESSDDSTIISSQASTLTRSMNPQEAMGLHIFEDSDLTSDDIVIPSEPCSLKAFDMDTFLKNSKTDRNQHRVRFRSTLGYPAG